MPGIYFAKISNNKSGFTNQIFALISSIMISKSRRNTIIVLDSLQCDFKDENNKINACDIFDLEKMNQNLKEFEFDIKIICRSQFNYKLYAIFYGAENNVIDITDKSPSIIESGSFNYIDGDPYPNVPKELFVNYSINGIEYNDLYQENHPYNIWVNGEPKYEYIFRWFNQQTKPIFERIMRCICYQPKINGHNFLPIIRKNTNRINVIHIRIEEDALEHWSRQNNLSQDVFKDLLEKKYIQMIHEHIHPKHNTIVVGDKNNKVIEYLKNNNYNHNFYNMDFNGRELNALYDLVQASQCNETFISNFNYQQLNGSTFSYYISVMSNPLKIVSIDIDNINSDAIIYMNKN
jgi:hypothetical protein